jgi:hypothetical protein
MIPEGPFIIPVVPFDPDRLARRAAELHATGVEWEFDWLTQEQADELTPRLQVLGVIP